MKQRQGAKANEAETKPQQRPHRNNMTWDDKCKTAESEGARMNEELEFAGQLNILTMP